MKKKKKNKKKIKKRISKVKKKQKKIISRKKTSKRSLFGWLRTPPCPKLTGDRFRNKKQPLYKTTIKGTRAPKGIRKAYIRKIEPDISRSYVFFLGVRRFFLDFPRQSLS